MSTSQIFLQHGRALEWATSSVLLAFAVILAIPGDTLTASRSFSGFTQIGFEEATLALPLCLIAVMRMAGLYINGRWRRSPFLRMIGAIAGAGMFLSISAVFVVPYVTGVQGALTTGVGAYMILGAFDILAAYRSAADVDFYKQH